MYRNFRGVCRVWLVCFRWDEGFAMLLTKARTRRWRVGGAGDAGWGAADKKTPVTAGCVNGRFFMIKESVGT